MTSRPSSFAIDVPEALLARMRRGEHAAFEQVYRWFERPVFTLALRICGDREEAGDVLQDTMLKLFNHLPDYRADCPFWGWLRQIAVNEALMRLRRALDEFIVDGVDTTLPLFRTLVRNPDILNGDYNIHWLEKFLAAGGMGEPEA